MSHAKKRILYDKLLRFLLYFCAFLTCALLAALIGCIFVRGLPNVSWQFLTSQKSVIRGIDGILPNIVNTAALVAGSLLIALPLGVGAAVYLTEYASNRKIVAVIEFAAETLSGIPSILFGLVGMLFFCRFLGWGCSLRAGVMTLAVMILPTIVRTTQESLKSVPQSYREGALGLGCGKWRMVRTLVLPSSAGGIVTGCILAVGRVTGESAALLYTAGSACVLAGPVSRFLGAANGNPIAALGLFLDRLYGTSGGSLTVSLYMYAAEEGNFKAAFAVATVLMALTLLINLLAKFAGRRLSRGAV